MYELQIHGSLEN